MRTLRFPSFVACLAVVAFAGCSGAATQPPLSGGMAPQNTQQLARHAATSFESPAQARVLHDALGLPRPQTASDHHGSWMAPEARSLKRLLYVADEGSGDVSVFSYPKGKAVGTLTGFNLPSGICTNKAGDVFILNGGGSTIEVYAHGGTQLLRTLSLPGAPWFNCSVDAHTGNLALGAFDGSTSAITIFKQANGKALTYIAPDQDGLPGCAYDPSGNLFCDAFSTGAQSYALFEMPKGSTTIDQIEISDSSIHAGAMMWDGKYLAFTNGSGGTIEQLQVSGSSASIVGSTTLNDTDFVWQFWIPGVPKSGEATRVIAPTYISPATTT
jgi:hypothetical protein